MVERVSRRIFGSFPYRRPWHPLHLPYRRLSEALNHAPDGRAPAILAVCGAKSILARRVASLSGSHVRVSPSGRLVDRATGIGPVTSPFDLCIVELSMTDLGQAPELYRAVLPHMAPDGTVVIHGNNLGLAPRESWEPAVINCLTQQPQAAKVHFSGSWVGVLAIRLLRLSYRTLYGSRAGSGYYGLPLLAGLGAGIASLALAARIWEGVRRQASSAPSACTGITVEIAVRSRL